MRYMRPLDSSRWPTTRRSFDATSRSYPILHRKLFCHTRCPLATLCSRSLRADMRCRITCHPGGMAVWKHSRLPAPAWIHSCSLSARRNSGEALLTSSAGNHGATLSASSPRSKRQFRARIAVDQAFTGSWQGQCQSKADRSGSIASSIVETRTSRWSWTWSSPRTLHGGSTWAMGVGGIPTQVPALHAIRVLSATGTILACCWQLWWHEAPTAGRLIV